MLLPVYLAQIVPDEGGDLLGDTLRPTYEAAAQDTIALALDHDPSLQVSLQGEGTPQPVTDFARLRASGATDFFADVLQLDFENERTELHGRLTHNFGTSGTPLDAPLEYAVITTPGSAAIALDAGDETRISVVVELQGGTPVLLVYDAGDHDPRIITELRLNP